MQQTGTADARDLSRLFDVDTKLASGFFADQGLCGCVANTLATFGARSATTRLMFRPIWGLTQADGWLRIEQAGSRGSVSSARAGLPGNTSSNSVLCHLAALPGCGAAAGYLDAYPQHQLDGRVVKIEGEREELIATVEHRLRRGDFNLGRNRR